MHPYQDTGTSPEARARDLVSRLTLEEKVAQLSGIWAYEVLTNFVFDEAKAKNRMGHGIGQITRAGGCTSLKPRATARLVNRIQRFLKDTMRIFIPAQVHEESCAGLLARDADVFPQALGVAASFSPAIAGEMGGFIREQMAALGSRQALAPLMDVTRDPRWGRTEETYGEDPFLVAQMGVAYSAACRGKPEARHRRHRQALRGLRRQRGRALNWGRTSLQHPDGREY
jgi:beta-glucosidase